MTTDEYLSSMTTDEYLAEAVRLLQQLIATPSASRNEDKAADIMESTIS